MIDLKVDKARVSFLHFEANKNGVVKSTWTKLISTLFKRSNAGGLVFQSA